MFYTIYRITNTINGREYIGAHKTDNPDDRYMGSGKNIKHAIDYYGIESFKKEILYVFNTEEEMYLKESELVTDEYISLPHTYNIKPGGKGGTVYEQSEEHKKKNSDALKGRVITPIHRKRISDGLKKYIRTDEHQQKINESVRSIVSSPEHRMKMSKQSKEIYESRPELREQISASVRSYYANETEEQKKNRILKHTGKIATEETRQKISLAHKGKRVGDKNHMFGKPAMNRRRVKGDGKIYDSVKSAAESLGLSQGTIVARCKSVKNAAWFYVD